MIIRVVHDASNVSGGNRIPGNQLRCWSDERFPVLNMTLHTGGTPPGWHELPILDVNFHTTSTTITADAKSSIYDVSLLIQEFDFTL
jgi:hypothetical protein